MVLLKKKAVFVSEGELVSCALPLRSNLKRLHSSANWGERVAEISPETIV